MSRPVPAGAQRRARTARAEAARAAASRISGRSRGGRVWLEPVYWWLLLLLGLNWIVFTVL